MTCRIVQALHSRTPRTHKPCKTLHGTYIYVLNVFMHHSEHSPWISSMPSHRPPCRVKCTRSHSPDATARSHPPSTHITNFTPPPHRHARHMPDPTLRKPRVPHAHRTPRHMHMHAMHPHNVPNTHPEHSPVQEHGLHLRVTCYRTLSAACRPLTPAQYHYTGTCRTPPCANHAFRMHTEHPGTCTCMPCTPTMSSTRTPNTHARLMMPEHLHTCRGRSGLRVTRC